MDRESRIKNGIQYRSMTLEIKDSSEQEESFIVEGYATTFNQPYVLFSDDEQEVREQVSPDAFAKCDMDDVIMQYDHCGHVFARIRNGSMELIPDEHGLFVRANLGGTTEGRKLYEEIKGGYTDRMSFGFMVRGEEVEKEIVDGRAIYLRTITDISRLFDVSAVSLPANDMTEISARAAVEGILNAEAEDIQKKAEEQAAEKAEAEKREAEEKARQERERLALELSFSF